MNAVGLPYIPKNWILANLEDCAEILDSKRIPINAKDRETRQGNIPYYGATGQVGWIDDFIFDEELVLLGEDGAPFLDPFKYKAYLIKGKSWVNNHAHVLKAIAEISLNSFLCSYLNTFDYHGYVTGTTRLKLNQAPMRGIPIPLPPLPEQHHIVAKIEELFAKLDAGVEALKKVRAQIKLYRQAILKYAFEGKLTQEWRETNQDKLESASILLEKIKEERRNKSGGKFKEFPPVGTTDLAKLPEGWTWASSSESCSSVRDGTHNTPKYLEEGVPLITSKNLKENGLDFSTARNISIGDHNEISKRSGVENGDVLFAMIGTIGNPVVVETEKIFSIKNVALFKKNNSVINSTYLKHWLSSWIFNRILEDKKLLKGTTQKFIPLEHLRILPIPLPPLNEQNMIVDEIESLFSMAEEVEKITEQSLKQSERLRQSILKDAFSGKLVPQDPTDEPAEEFLERIKAEKAKKESEPKGRSKKSNQMERV